MKVNNNLEIIVILDEASEERVVISERLMHPHRLLNTILKLVPL